MNDVFDPSREILNCLIIGLSDAWQELVAEELNEAQHDTVDTLDEARPLIERQPPSLVLIALPSDESLESSLSLLRRCASEAKIFLLTAEPPSVIPNDIDDLFELPREQQRLVMRVRRELKVLEVRLQRRLRAARLASDNDRFTMAFHGSDDGLWDAKVYWPEWFADDNEVWFSSRFKSLMGFEDDEFDNRLGSWKKQVYPDDQKRVYEALDAHLHRRVDFDIEYRVFNKKGEIIWLRGLGKATWDRNGIPIRMAGSTRDITARKQAEEDRDQFFCHSIDLFCYADLSGYFLRVNPAFTATLGYSEEELLSRSFLDFIHPDDRQLTLDEIEHLREGHDTLNFENRYLHQDGSIRWLSWRVPAPLPGRSTLFAVARDITRQKQDEQALQQERDSLKWNLGLQERDRKLVSFEIHDGVVQQMTAALMHLETFCDARRDDAERAERNLQKVLELMPMAVEEARRVISGLRPPVLDDLGLVAGIEYLTEQACRSIPEVIFLPEDDLPKLPKPLEDSVFRVAQESLTNATRHSNSKRVEVRLWQEEKTICLSVQDWGDGFDTSQPHPGHFGLQGMRERCRVMDCELSIDSQPGEGTTVTICVPLEQ